MKVYKAYTGSLSGECLVSLVLWIHVLGNMYLYLCILEPHCVYTLFYRKRHYMVLGPNRIATSLDRLIIPRTREVSRVEKSPICISLILSVVHHLFLDAQQVLFSGFRGCGPGILWAPPEEVVPWRCVPAGVCVYAGRDGVRDLPGLLPGGPGQTYLRRGQLGQRLWSAKRADRGRVKVGGGLLGQAVRHGLEARHICCIYNYIQYSTEYIVLYISWFWRGKIKVGNIN